MLSPTRFKRSTWRDESGTSRTGSSNLSCILSVRYVSNKRRVSLESASLGS